MEACRQQLKPPVQAYVPKVPLNLRGADLNRQLRSCNRIEMAQKNSASILWDDAKCGCCQMVQETAWFRSTVQGLQYVDTARSGMQQCGDRILTDRFINAQTIPYEIGQSQAMLAQVFSIHSDPKEA